MWYVVQVMTGEEMASCLFCKEILEEEYYFDVFVPVYMHQRHYCGKWHKEKKVLFPGYFFVDTEHIVEVQEALEHMPRFARFLRNAELVCPVLPEEQKFLQSMMDAEYLVEISQGLIIGDEIIITSGPLKNHQGFIRRVDRHKRTADLEIDLFGRMTKVQVGLEILKKIPQKSFRQYIENHSPPELPEESEDVLVCIQSGIFAGMVGRMLAVDSVREEIKVSLELFGKSVPVVFSMEEVERTGWA